jgi:hypothetical protein
MAPITHCQLLRRIIKRRNASVVENIQPGSPRSRTFRIIIPEFHPAATHAGGKKYVDDDDVYAYNNKKDKDKI